jgi:hypothetical protein
VWLVKLGETKIDDLGRALSPAALGQEDILGFQIPVYDALIVRLL